MTKTSSLLVAAVALVAAACSPGESTEPTATTLATTTTTMTTPTPTPTMTTPASATTPTLAPIEVFDTVNGLEPLSDEILGVIAIKIDNHPKARPHTGLQYADIVYELPVESGLTRLIAIYDRYEVAKVGPVRSLRPTDVEIVNPIGVPLQVSGGSNWVLKKVRASGTKLLTDTGQGTYRDNSRRAPHNLYADTAAIRVQAEKRWGLAAPGNLFVYGAADDLKEVALEITIPFSPQVPSIWNWDAEARVYLHSYGDELHMSIGMEGEEVQVTATTLIVIFADRYTARPPKPSDGTAVPSMDLTGTGGALVFHDGRAGEATWIRENLNDSIAFVNLDGSPVTIKPGIVWVSIVLTTQAVAWE